LSLAPGNAGTRDRILRVWLKEGGDGS